MSVVGFRYLLTEESKKDVDVWKNKLKDLEKKLSSLSLTPVCAKCKNDLSEEKNQKYIVGEAETGHVIKYYTASSIRSNIAFPHFNKAIFTYKLQVCPKCFKKFLLKQYTRLMLLKWYLPTLFIIGGSSGALFCSLWYLPLFAGIILAIACGIFGKSYEKSYFEKNRESNPDIDFCKFLTSSWFANEIKQDRIYLCTPNRNNITAFLNKKSARVELQYKIKDYLPNPVASLKKK
jgi:hypothetical protein